MGLNITVTTILRPYEDSDNVITSINNIFPDWRSDSIITKQSFPTNRLTTKIKGYSINFEKFILLLRKQKILDTAFDVMTKNLKINYTFFSISRQSAMKEVISFIVQDIPLGGSMEIELEKENLEIWLEDQTWHPGRELIPRQVNDDLAMKINGEPVEWFDKFGNPTMAPYLEEE